MAGTDRFYIGQVNGQGLQSDLKPYAIPDNAFADLNNAYVFRGRVRKRFGSKLMIGTDAQISGLEQIQSRLKINVGTTNGVGALAGTVPGAVALGVFGQAFSVGANFFTVSQPGTPATMLTTGLGTGTFNTTNGAFSIVGAPIFATVYFYPGLPVMGLVTYEKPETSTEDVIAFDTQFAYQFGNNGWERMGTALWTGSNSQFFWGANWNGLTSSDIYLFVTNYNAGSDLTDSDTIQYWDGSTWTSFNPGFSSSVATNTVVTARIIIPFKDRLVLLNVVENTGVGPGTNARYVNRCRFSWNGSPVDSTAFYEDVPGKGGYIDAPTKEAIITAQFLKDRLIVYFEASTWELAYTGNQILPFVWQRINTELGAESTFSQVPFDKVVLGVGNVGIHACNGSNVERIDDKIPDEVFNIHNDNNGIERVAGIRDYYTEMVYWTFPSQDRDSSYPFNNKVLTYNYKNGNWAFNDDSITAFGYWQTVAAGTSLGLSWSQATMTWNQANNSWTSGTLQAKFRNVIAGNQQGYVFIIDPELSVNSPSLQITNLVYSSFLGTAIFSIDHNLKVGDYVKIENAQGVTSLNGLIRQVVSVLSGSFVIDTLGDTITGTYTGGGTIRRVTPIDFKTKQYNFYSDQGRNAYISRLDCFVDRTDAGQCTVDFLVGSSDQGMISQAALTGAMVGTSVLETSPYALDSFEQQQERLWHPVYFMAEGEAVQFRFHLNDSQIKTPAISESEFELHAMIIYSTPTSSRI